MFESVLCVKYVSYKNCFVYLSPSHANLNTGAYIKVSYADRENYFSARVIRDSVDGDSIGINPSYAKLLGITENDLVNVTHLEQLPVVNSITIRASSQSDYEILEILSQNVQSSLLDQVRVVATGQNMLIWVGSNLTVSVNVEHVQPISPGTLDFLTEVIINPPHNGISRPQNIPKSVPAQNPLKKIIHEIIEKNTEQPVKHDLAKTDIELCYRLVPLSDILSRKTQKILPFCGFLPRANLPDCDFVCMSPINNTDKHFYIKICPIEDYFDIPICQNNLFIEDSIIPQINTDIFSRVILTKPPPTPHITQIAVHSKKNYLSNTTDKFKQFLADCPKPFILNANFPIKIDNLYVSLKFLPNLGEFCLVDDDFLRNVLYSLLDEPVRPLEPLKTTVERGEFCEQLNCYEEVRGFVEGVLFKDGRFAAENVIIAGKPGMGKSSILHHISTNLKSYPYFINTELVQCKKIKGKTVDSLHKFFGDIFNKLIHCQPSLLIMDDMEVLCEFCEGEETPNSVYFNRVSEMIHSLFSAIPKHNQIGILASTKSISKLNRHIYRSRGNHMFKNVISMKDLDKEDRICLMKFYFEQHPVESVDYEELSIKTDGFVIQDIKDFYEKTLFEAYKGLHKNDNLIISPSHIDKALKKSCALSLQNVKFHSTGSKGFDDIGGLQYVKNILVESLLWPVKYSSIFANSPLRLQSGILLYGPPGTGKTLLAGAAAKQCSLRLISIKGPELLSKYIGASEQAVRDVFEKAQRAKPCILFFDEFDSLAPRRGHDNTGVTDRVVNQLLTQLDGVEALTGVCVLAATSRPDLLDPALLRPGRLDKQLMCPMPDRGGRLEILQTLSNKLQLSEEVDLDEIALKTDGYSGADLQSVLYTAQMSTMKDLMDNGEGEINKVTHAMLLGGMAKTRPSLTKAERLKYDVIYKKFQGGKVEDFQTGSKVTLA